MAAINSCDFYSDLRKLIDLPENCTSVDIHLGVNEPVVVHCTYFSKKGTEETINKRFNIVPADD